MAKGRAFPIRFLWIGVAVALPLSEVAIAGATDGPPAQRNDASRPWTVPELVGRYKDSAESVRTLSAAMRTVTGRKFPEALGGLKRDDTGRVIAYEVSRDWEAATGKYRLERSLLTVADGVASYKPQVSASDGTRFRGYNPDPEALPSLGGLIGLEEAPPRGACEEGYWIPHLLGHHFAPGPDRSLWEILDGAKVVEVEGTPPHLAVLETKYKFFGDHNETRLRAWLDTTHGCLPSRVEAVRLWSGTLSELFEVDEFHEAAQGLWVPVRGSIHRFSIDMVLPKGLTKEDVPRFTTDQLRALGVLYVSKPLGDGDGFFPDELIVDTATLRVNAAIPRERFLLEFPAGMRVLDTTRTPPLRYTVGAD